MPYANKRMQLLFWNLDTQSGFATISCVIKSMSRPNLYLFSRIYESKKDLLVIINYDPHTEMSTDSPRWHCFFRLYFMEVNSSTLSLFSRQITSLRRL